MHRGRTAGGLRSSWRQQQAVAAAAERAALQPTLAARPLLLRARLAPLFASYGQELASEAGLEPRGGTKAAVLGHLRKLEGLDGWHGVDRAVLHGLLFSCWPEARRQRLPTAPGDDLAPDSDWALSTRRQQFPSVTNVSPVIGL